MEEMSDKEWFETDPTLESITHNRAKLDQIIYENIMNKYVKTGEDLLNLPHEPNDYIVENFLWHDDVAFIVGKEKACKSILTTQEAMAISCGAPFLGSFEVKKPMKVLYVQAEGSLGQTKERLLNSLQENGLEWNPSNWGHCFPPSLGLDTQAGYEMFKEGIENSEFHPELVIIDPLYCAMEGDLSDNKAVRHFNGNIRRLKEAWRCSFIIVHHEHRPKTDVKGYKVEEGDNSIFGSSMLKNFASHVIRITIVNEHGTPINDDADGKGKYRKLTCTTQRNGNVEKKVMMVLNESPLMFEVLDKGTSGTESTILLSLRSHGPSTYEMLMHNTALKKGTVRNSVCSLRKKGLIKNGKKEGLHVYLEAV